MLSKYCGHWETIIILLCLFYTVIPLNLNVMLFACLCYSVAFKKWCLFSFIYLLCHLKFLLLYMCNTRALCTLEQQMTGRRSKKSRGALTSWKQEGLTTATPATASLCAATSPSFLCNLNSWYNCGIWGRSHWPRIACIHRIYYDSCLKRK